MLVFLPVLILITSLLVLAFSNLRRPMRSSWLVAVSGAGLALASVLFLRLRLPLSTNVVGWSAGPDQEFNSVWALTETNWSLVLAVSSFLVASLLLRVEQAVGAAWLDWGRSLAVTASSMFAILAGDLLALMFSLTLLDGIVFLLQIRLGAPLSEKGALLNQLGVNLAGNMFLITAWALRGTGSFTVAIMMAIAAAIRLGLFTLQFEKPKYEGLLSLIVFSPSIALVLSGQPISPQLIIPVALLLMLPATYSAVRNLEKPAADESFWILGVMSLALLATIVGNSPAALAFGFAAILGPQLQQLVQISQRFRFLAAAVGVVSFSALPFTPTYLVVSLYLRTPVPVVYASLPVYALLLLGWVRRAMRQNLEEWPAEPWMRTIRGVGYFLVPLLFLLLGLGLMPVFDPEIPTLIWWPGVGFLVLVGFLALLTPVVKRPRSPNLTLIVDSIFSLRWITRTSIVLFHSIESGLRFVSQILEGQAGVLWALLVIALILSLVAQLGIAS